MITVNTEEAESRLAELLSAVEERGESVRICRNGTPIAELRPVARVKDSGEPNSEIDGEDTRLVAASRKRLADQLKLGEKTDPFQQDPKLMGVQFHEDPLLPFGDEDWPEESR